MSYRLLELKDFTESSLTLLTGLNIDDGGSNGSGKSCIWDAFSWCLFGQTVRGVKNDEVINRDNGKDCSVEIRLSKGDTKYKIRRYRKHKEFQNRLIVQKGPQIKEWGTVTQTQEWLLKELGIDFDLFRCTIVFAQGETFNFVGETNKRQKEILSKVMRVNFDKLLERTKTILKKEVARKQDIENRLIALRSQRVDDIDGLYRQEIAEWKGERDKKEQELVLEIEEIKKKLDEKMKVLKDVTMVRQLRRGLVEKIDFLSKKKGELVEKRFKISNAMVVKKTQIEEMETTSSKQGKCPVCFQPINEFVLIDKVENARKMIDFLIPKEGVLTKTIQYLIEKQNDFTIKLGKVEDLIRENDNEQFLVGSWKKEIRGLETRVKVVKKETNPFEKRLEREKENQTRIKKEIKAQEKEGKKIDESCEYYNFWSDAFGDSGIKSFVFDLICSSLTEKTNYYLNKLTNGQVTLQFNTQTKLKSGELREKFEALILSNGETIRYEAYSGGEKRRISLAVDLALSEIMTDYYGTDFNLLVFDESLNYMDDEGRKCFFDLLKELSERKRIFVVEHNNEFQAMFDELITIRKENGISSVV